MGSGYFLQGLADGLKSGGLMDRGGRLAREKFEYQKRRDALMDERVTKALLLEEAKNKKEENLRNYYRSKVGGLMPELAETDFPSGAYKSLYDTHVTSQDIVADNANLGRLLGIDMPEGASLSDDLLGKALDYKKHQNPKLTGDIGNLKQLYPAATSDDLVAKAAALNRAKAARTTTHINQFENYKDKGLFNLDLKNYEGVLSGGEDARKKLANIQALRSIPLTTDGDPLVGMKTTLKKYGGSIGVPVDMEAIANIEQAMALTNQMALDALDSFKGGTSEKELEFARSATVKLTQPAQTRQWLMDVEEAKRMMEIEKAKFYREYRTSKKDIEGVAHAWEKKKQVLPPLFGRSPKENHPITWYAYKRGVLQYALEKGTKIPSERELINKWRSTYAVR